MAGPDPSTVRFNGPWVHNDIRANGIRFHVVEAIGSPSDAPLVLLLHGFADFWWSWRHQLLGLAEAGLRAVAVDLRGYGDSDKPPRGYDGWTLAGDVAGLVRALGHSEAGLVGHAEGGWVCWATAALHPRLVATIALIGSPHPAALAHAVRTDPTQRAAWLPCFLQYQVPRYAEHRLIAGDGYEVERLLHARCTPEWTACADFDDTVRRMRSAVQIPGAAHCALEYQRWAFRSQFRPDGRRFRTALSESLNIPVLAMRGEADPYISARTVRGGSHLSPHRTMLEVPEAGHFAHQENPRIVTARLAEFAWDGAHKRA